SLAWRRTQLEGIIRFLTECETELTAALAADLGKPALASWMADIVPPRNAAVLKPSELAPATAGVLAEWLPRYVDPSAVAVVEGGMEVSQALLERPFDHIFFTGSPRVGRIVVAAAAR